MDKTGNYRLTDRNERFIYPDDTYKVHLVQIVARYPQR